MCGTVHVPASLSSSLGNGKHEFVRLSRTHLLSDGTPYSDIDWDMIETIFAPLGLPQGPKNLDEDSEVEGNEFGGDDGCIFDTGIYDIDIPWCIFNVMLVETTEEVSRRVGLGKVHIAAFTQGDSCWRDIVLA
jgi:hypothetical protein